MAEEDTEAARVAHEATARLLRVQEEAPRETPSLTLIVQIRRVKGE